MLADTFAGCWIDRIDGVRLHSGSCSGLDPVLSKNSRFDKIALFKRVLIRCWTALWQRPVDISSILLEKPNKSLHFRTVHLVRAGKAKENGSSFVVDGGRVEFRLQKPFNCVARKEQSGEAPFCRLCPDDSNPLHTVSAAQPCERRFSGRPQPRPNEKRCNLS